MKPDAWRTLLTKPMKKTYTTSCTSPGLFWLLEDLTRANRMTVGFFSWTLSLGAVSWKIFSPFLIVLSVDGTLFRHSLVAKKRWILVGYMCLAYFSFIRKDHLTRISLIKLVADILVTSVSQINSTVRQREPKKLWKIGTIISKM